MVVDDDEGARFQPIIRQEIRSPINQSIAAPLVVVGENELIIIIIVKAILSIRSYDSNYIIDYGKQQWN